MWADAKQWYPAASGYYLCVMAKKYKICFWWHDRMEWECNGRATNKITHWMCLPAMPQEGDNT